ncbi:MAG: HAMP domain-containing protein [Lachnospiraceae bacterium]|nr:HAMP domain-containing protein [Lachnospiraceae bacterium]
MISKCKTSLRFKLTMFLMVIMAFTVFGSLLVTQLFVKTFFLSELKYRMINMYEDVNFIFSQENINDVQVTEQLSRLAANGEINIFVLSKDNKIYSNINEESEMWDSMQSIATLLEGQNEQDLGEILQGQQQGFWIFHQNHDKKLNSDFYDLVGVLDDGSLIALRSSVVRFNESVATTMKLYLYVGFFAILGGCTAMFFVSSSYVRPIHQMAVAAKRMARLDFDAKVQTHSNDEIGELGASINAMSKELETTISELKTANAKLMQDIEEKTQIDEMRKEFLSHVSHELKTPIALIQGYAEGLKENISDDPESRDFYCEVIMDEADRMNVMVKKLLALNELEFGTDKINFERFDVVELMRNVNSSVDILLQQNRVNLQFLCQYPINVWADEFMIEEVYRNYLVNAIYHTAEGKNVCVNADIRDNLLRVQVYNEGEFIPEDELEKIWIKFYKVDKARTREYGGSGIGLSIVAATMKLHGRRYGAFNAENGVVFYFELELSKEHLVNEKS